MLLCFHHKKCAKLHRQSQFTSKFIPTSVRDIFKQSNLMNHTKLQGFWKVAEKKSNFVAFSETDSQKFLGANFADKTIGKKQLISREFSGQILLEIDRFYTDLTSVFNVF